MAPVMKNTLLRASRLEQEFRPVFKNTLQNKCQKNIIMQDIRVWGFFYCSCFALEGATCNKAQSKSPLIMIIQYPVHTILTHRFWLLAKKCRDQDCVCIVYLHFYVMLICPTTRWETVSSLPALSYSAWPQIRAVILKCNNRFSQPQCLPRSI